MSLSSLPLQDMIASVVKTASDRLSAQRSTETIIKSAAAGTDEETCEDCGKEKDACECGSKTASDFTDPSYVEKLASVCDFISQNVENIAAPNRGVLGDALAKLAENGLPADHGETVPPTNPEGALETTTGMEGTQEYKKDKPKGDDASASQAGTPETKANMPGGTTQISNNMDRAPGNGSGSVPDATYPADGPFHQGAKTAGKLSNLAGAAKKGLGRAGELLAGGKKHMMATPGKGGRAIGRAGEMRPGNHASALKHQGGVGSEAKKSLGARAGAGVAIGGVGASFSGKGKKEKTAAELARELILAKLAGEDVTSANISSDGSGGPLVGDGELDALQSGNRGPDPNAGTGYGNEQRNLIDSNEAAMNYTKGDAKKPQAKQLAEVIEQPAFSPEHDSKLREQLRNAGEAGVKIAGANAVSFLKQAAAKGVLTQETVDAFKAKTKTASDQATTHGASAQGEAAVSKLRSMMDAQKKQKASMGDDGGGAY